MRTSLAALLALTFACQDPESPPPAAGDAVTVRVTDGGIPVAGVTVAFHGAAGDLLGTAVADGVGEARHAMEPGGLVTVAYPAHVAPLDSRLQLITYAGVDPGQTITIEIPDYGNDYWPRDPAPVVGQLQIMLPSLANADRFVIHLGCIDYSTDQRVTVVDVPQDCLGSDDRVDLTVEAFTAPDLPARLATTFASDIAVSGDGIAEISLPAWVDPLPTIDVVVSDLPAAASDVHATPVMLADGLAFDPVQSDGAPAANGPITLSPQLLPAFARQIDLDVWFDDGAGRVTSVEYLGMPVESSVAVSGTSFLPLLRDLVTDGQQLAWSAAGDTSSADAALLSLSSERTEGAIRRSRRWIVLAPPDVASPFTLPELPNQMADYRPRPDDDYVEPGVTILDADWIDGWQRFVRDHGTGFLDDPCLPVYSQARTTRAGAFNGPNFATAGY